MPAGIPDRQDFGRPERLPPGLARWILQSHRADRAGPHTDFRLGTPDVGLLSWATKKELPVPGGRPISLFRQPLHSYEYGDFEGEIPRGQYGAGQVRKKSDQRVLVTSVKPDAIRFTTGESRHPERFLLARSRRDPKVWLLVNTTPTKGPGFEKPRYKKIPSDQIEPRLKALRQGETTQAKLDGASSLVSLMRDGVELTSYRTSRETGRPIFHTERVFHGRPGVRIPGELSDSILRAELYGVRDDVQDSAGPGGGGGGGGRQTKGRPGGGVPAPVHPGPGDGKRRSAASAISPQELGGLLNSGVAKSIDDQRVRGISLRLAPFDVARFAGTDVDPRRTPRSERLRMLGRLLPYLPSDRFQVPETAEDPAASLALLDRIRSGRDPLTTEGVVIHPELGLPTKGKLTEERNVLIRSIFPGRGRLSGKGAGGFSYSAGPESSVLGRVGTGFSDETRRDMLTDPAGWVGRRARISTQQTLPSGAYRAPAFIALTE